ncbi:MAG: NUDIX domain-containing protein, partial [Nanoarchaeota archaeon]
MKKNYRKGIFIVVYTIYNNEIFYLLLKRKLHWKGWEFPKAGVKEKESLIECAKRELKEETGLKPI